MFRLLVVAAVALVLAVSGALGLARDLPAEKSQPLVHAGSSAEVPATADDLTAYVAALQDRLRRLPADDSAWASLGLAYVEQARLTGNPTFYTEAERAIDRSFEERPTDNGAALAADAALEAARHHFTASLRSANRALRIDPYNPGALAVKADAVTELGRYDAQLKAVRVADRRQPGVPTAARYAYALELRGRLDEASGILAQAAETASDSDRAYLLTLLADLERRQGRLDRSERHLDESLRVAPDYVPALVATARLATARGDLRGAARIWERVVGALPLPEYLTELGEVDAALGRHAAAQQQFDVVEATTRLFADSGVDTDLEVALFNADHGDPAAALASARAEWDRRKSIHVADALGWALHQVGNDAKALTLARRATRLGTAEARLWLHRGAIEAALGMAGPARAHLLRGLRTDPGVSPWQSARARATLHDLEEER